MASRQITTGGKERVSQAVKLLTGAFETDPTLAYILNSPSKEAHLARLSRMFEFLMTAAGVANASFDEIGDWESCGVIIPPGSTIDTYATYLSAGVISTTWTLGPGTLKRILMDYSPAVHAIKDEALRNDKRYFYVFFLGTREDARGRGHCSTMIRHCQARAQETMTPIWMEAATDYCWRLYEKLGFTTVGEVFVGKGKAAADGTHCPGGPGVKLRGMIWRPVVKDGVL